ncbi:MAG TPA: hypothetical protein DCL40_02160 [Coxiellaceae bacterium]|nr:hypothetical protein [Coxiellaceae bacterium]
MVSAKDKSCSPYCVNPGHQVAGVEKGDRYHHGYPEPYERESYGTVTSIRLTIETATDQSSEQIPCTGDECGGIDRNKPATNHSSRQGDLA